MSDCGAYKYCYDLESIEISETLEVLSETVKQKKKKYSSFNETPWGLSEFINKSETIKLSKSSICSKNAYNL